MWGDVQVVFRELEMLCADTGMLGARVAVVDAVVVATWLALVLMVEMVRADSRTLRALVVLGARTRVADSRMLKALVVDWGA